MENDLLKALQDFFKWVCKPDVLTSWVETKYEDLSYEEKKIMSKKSYNAIKKWIKKELLKP